MVLDLLALVAQLSGNAHFYQPNISHFYIAAGFWPLMILLDKENRNSDADNIIVWALPAGLVTTTFQHLFTLLHQLLTSCGYWETFTSEDSWTRVGQWLYEVENSSTKLLGAGQCGQCGHCGQVKAEMVLGRLVQKDGHLATDLDGNPRQVR